MYPSTLIKLLLILPLLVFGLSGCERGGGLQARGLVCHPVVLQQAKPFFFRLTV